MHLELEPLLDTPAVAAAYDRTNDWLYLEWRGNLTLALVQAGCVAVAQCCLSGSYRRILNDNSNVTHMAADVSEWLATVYLPHVPLAGIEHVAWVVSPNPEAQNVIEVALYDQAAPVVALFSDVAAACDWLRLAPATCAVPAPGALHSPAEQQVELAGRVAAAQRDLNK